MQGKVVTVFGGSGFIGRLVVQRLAARGAVIRVPTRNPATAHHLRPLGAVGQIVIIKSRIGGEEMLRELVRGADHVVNLVGILSESRGVSFEQVQGELPGRIARHAAAEGVRSFVQISAIGADPASTSRYARSKATGEANARAAFPDTVVLRPSIVFGPGDGFFSRFAAMSRFLPALPLIGGGTMRFQPVYVGDVADAVVAGLDRAELAGRTFELGGPAVRTFKELLQYILALLERPRLLVNLPWGIAARQARLMELLPDPPLTRDQLELLKRDNVVAPGAATLAELGISPTPFELIVPTYLRPSHRHGVHLPAA